MANIVSCKSGGSDRVRHDQKVRMWKDYHARTVSLLREDQIRHDAVMALCRSGNITDTEFRVFAKEIFEAPTMEELLAATRKAWDALYPGEEDYEEDYEED